MVIANLAAIVAVAALLLVRSAGTAWIAVVAVGCFAVAKAFYSPAASAALPNTVDAGDLPTANALSGSAWGTMLVVGASLGGVVSAAVGPYVCFGVTVVCLLASALAVWRVRRPLQAVVPVSETPCPRPTVRRPRRTAASRRQSAAADGAWPALVEAARYIRGNPRVASLVTVKSAVGLGNGVLVAFPLLATAVFRIGELGTGLLFAARGAGALIGPLLFRWVLKRRGLLLPALAVSMSAVRPGVPRRGRDDLVLAGAGPGGGRPPGRRRQLGDVELRAAGRGARRAARTRLRHRHDDRDPGGRGEPADRGRSSSTTSRPAWWWRSARW